MTQPPEPPEEIQYEEVAQQSLSINPAPGQPLQTVPIPSLAEEPDRPTKDWGEKTEEFLDRAFKPLEAIGNRVFGENWRFLYLTGQDALTL
ncbi:MAG: hypothetical protein KME17_07100 [Cyanosarcina radialis HA8281-LM2]|jgi:hypothetical protein|nr:hypothetical protein [Cyanosarcina radialis HA8281-LM2]